MICIGAVDNFQDADGRTPLQIAQEKLAHTSVPDEVQPYAKVHEDKQTPHFNNTM